MLKVFCDEYLIFDDSMESLKIISPKISSELNAVSSFTFTIFPNHPYFDRLQKLKSIVKVIKDGVMLFRGRILNDVNGFHNEKKVTCEGDLAFLLDSVQRPYEFSGTPSELFTQLLNSHNSQVGSDHQFKVGTCTVTDPNDYISRSDTTYQNTFDALQDKLVRGLGGYLIPRYESDGVYLDYLADVNLLSPQKIEFGKNLLDVKQTVKADDIFTVIVPIGAEVEKEIPNPLDPDNPTIVREKITIKDVNGGLDYLENSQGIAKYGRIEKMVEWADVTIPNNLKTKAQRYLDEHVLLMNNIELSAADLSGMNQNIGAFHLGTKVQVISKPHGINSLMIVNRLSLDLLNPANNKLSLGSEFKSMSESQKSDFENVMTQVNQTINNVRASVINQTTRQLQTTIETTSKGILQTVSETYTTKTEVPQLIEEKTSSLEQTVDGFNFSFNQLKTSFEEAVQGTDAEFENIRKYIRFIDGKILLGEVGNSLELQISNDRISFLQDNSEVAYFSNNKLFVVDGEFTNSLQLGKFAFFPRATGNLSFMKVRS